MKKIDLVYLINIFAIISTLFPACIREHVREVKLNKSEIILYTGCSETLIATVIPENADNSKVTWKSSNPEIATVDRKGLVTAVNDGKATITVTTKDGKHTASCKVTVDFRGKWVGDWDITTIDFIKIGVMPPFEITNDTVNYIGTIETYDVNRLKIVFKPNATYPNFDNNEINGLIYPIVGEGGLLTYPEYNNRCGFGGLLGNDTISIQYCLIIGHHIEAYYRIQGTKIHKK